MEIALVIKEKSKKVTNVENLENSEASYIVSANEIEQLLWKIVCKSLKKLKSYHMTQLQVPGTYFLQRDSIS